MDQKLNNLFSRLGINNRSGLGEAADGNGPQIGFNLRYNSAGSELKVKVIGARKLPPVYGNVKPKAYSAKITLFPEKEKNETQPMKDTNPIINQEFDFKLHPPIKSKGDPLKGKFISFTVYANLDDEPQTSSSLKPTKFLQRFFSFSDADDSLVQLRTKTKDQRTAAVRQSYRNSLNKRRTVGTVQYNLDIKSFTQSVAGSGIRATPDIWRPILDTFNGNVGPSRDGTKGSVEVTLSYAVSEDGTNDVVEIGVTKFRCSVQTMQHHERIGGQLYIKITAFEREDLVQKMKCDKFEPTISLKLENTTSTLRANVSQYNLNEVKILVRLMSRNLLGKKELLGKIEIDRNSDVWREIVAQPSIPVTKWINFD